MATTVADIATRALRRLGVAVVADADRPALTTTIAAADIATSALIELGVIDAAETPAAADQALALAKVNAVHDSLVSQGFATWTAGAVPQAVSEEYIKLTAVMLASAFGKSADAALFGQIEQRVRKYAVMVGSLALATQSVMAVHRNLAARGLTRWTSFDIPDAVGDSYSDLAAADLAPQFGMQVPPAEAALAMRTIYQLISLPSSGERVLADYF